MAIEIKIHPLDFEPDTAIGIDLPMMAGTGAGFQQTYMTLDQAVANSKNLLYTNKGERIMQPQFGCDLRSIVFDNLLDDLLEKVDNTIRSSFNYWLPYIVINELDVSSSPDQNRLFIKMSISLQGNLFDTRSIQVEVINTR